MYTFFKAGIKLSGKYNFIVCKTGALFSSEASEQQDPLHHFLPLVNRKDKGLSWVFPTKEVPLVYD